MIRLILTSLWGFLVGGCMAACPIGSDCERSCPPGTSSMCAPDDVCICAGAQFSNSRDPRKAACRAPAIGDLVITEVLVDGDPTEKEEFVELVNTAPEPINMDGVVILTERSGRLRKHVLFAHGCLASKTAIAMYSDMDRRVWSPQLDPTIVAVTSSFGFANSRDFRLVLESETGLILDEVFGPQGMIREGVSIGRSAPKRSVPVELHSHFAHGRRRSPGTCPLGGTYHEECAVADNMGSCYSPEPGELVINEVMIDGEPDATQEFVELVNVTRRAISLGGLELLSNRGAAMGSRVRFLSGCIPATGIVAMYADPTHCLWEPPTQYLPQMELSRFGFANSADFRFVLQTVRGMQIDEFKGVRELIEPGISLNRKPDIYGGEVVLHSTLSPATHSPSRRSNGDTYLSKIKRTDSNPDDVSNDAGVSRSNPAQDAGIVRSFSMPDVLGIPIQPARDASLGSSDVAVDTHRVQ